MLVEVIEPDVVKEPLTTWLPTNVFEPVVAKLLVLLFKEAVYASNVPTRVFKDDVVVYIEAILASFELV